MSLCSMSQRDINTLFQVTESWGLALNPYKSVVLRFTMNNTFGSGFGKDVCYYRLSTMFEYLLMSPSQTWVCVLITN